MNIGREPTYLSTDVWGALCLIAKSKDTGLANAAWTPDFVADEMLREKIKEKYPQLFEHQKKVEAELIKTLQ